MKVFINFGDIRCVVPVGDGSLTVKEVIDLAVERYRKAISKPKDSKINVSTLKTCRDGAILDPDDILSDVADDREQLIALFEHDDDDVQESHYYCKSTQSKANNFFGEMPPTRCATNKSNVSHSADNPHANVHQLNHYSHSNAQPDSIYGHTNGNSLNSSNTSFSISYAQNHSHHRNDSISDSLLSSNESPDVFQHDSLPEDGYCGHMNRLPTTNYSYREPYRFSNSSETTANGRMKETEPECQNVSNSNRPIPINDSRRTEYLLSHSYDSKFCPPPDSYDDCDDVVEITAEQINSYATLPLLHVRHGSEPTLNCSTPAKSNHCSTDSRTHPANNSDVNKLSQPNDLFDNQANKRWSTAISMEQNMPTSKPRTLVANYEHLDENKSLNSISPQSTKEEGYASEERSNSQSEQTQPMSSPSNNKTTSPQTFGKFHRGSGRLSMIVNNLDVWADAADRQLLRLRNKSDNAHVDLAKSHSSPLTKVDQHNKLQVYDSSLGSMSNSSQENENNSNYASFRTPNQLEPNTSNDIITVIIDLAKESGPLGIHVLPDTSVEETDSLLKNGLFIQGIEPGGRIDRDGRLHVGDTIIEVDNKKFSSLNFEEAQNIFRSSLQNDQIKMKIIKSYHNTYENSIASPTDNSHCDQRDKSLLTDKQEEEKKFVEGSERVGQQTKIATVTATRKHSTGIIGSKPPSSAIVIANTRRIGKKYHIQLQKGDQGLGFTITTRDNPAGGQSPIYIKTILPQGAALQDGRLKPGDRLLEVCGIEMTGKTQEEAVKILRNLPQDSIVDIIVSRQELEMSPSPLMPRQLPPEKVNEPVCSSSNEREVMKFKIPLNDTGSAGLGVSVKGKTSSENGKQVDLGIFVKSVIHGGAASKDGRLKQDDQLININEITLSGKTNSEAMETLRRALIHSADTITLTIARRNCRSPSHCTDLTTSQFYQHRHETSILSNDSYDMSFTTHSHDISIDKNYNPNPTSPYAISHNDSGCHEDDSYRSSDNTVIYNASANHVNKEDLIKTLNDSELSLNDDQAAERFRRDGFGRQSMSEKRHAQLDAKNTDTYRRNKKSKDEYDCAQDDCPNEKTVINSQNEPYNISLANQANISPYGEDEHLHPENAPGINLPSPNENDQSRAKSSYTPKAKTPTRNQMFSPTWCWKCQSPGSCPCRSKSELSTDLCEQRFRGRFMANSHFSPPVPRGEFISSPLGLRKSCSLESLQTMMQDLQKEQVGQVGGNIQEFSGARHGTVRVGRSRETNESFRNAVDRSYETKAYFNHSNSDCDNSHEDSLSKPSTCPYRVGGGHSMTSTNITATTTNLTATTTDDDNEQLIKSKKKKGIFKNLFHFGSRKGRSKSTSDQSDSKKHKDLDDSFGDVNLKYQIEQEKIRMQYRKLMEQHEQKQKQQQQYGFIRNQLHPMHQSMPPSVSHRLKNNSSKVEPMIGTIGKNPYYAAPGLYGTVMNRDNVGVPNKNVYMRQHRIYPEAMKDANRKARQNSQGCVNEGEPHHMRINSQDFYNRNSAERPGSRVAVSDNNNYATYGAYSNYNGNNSASGLPNPAQFNTVSYRVDNADNIHHYRQLSLRNPQHNRQVSSPVTSQQYYSTGRPMSSYFEYEHANVNPMRKVSNSQLPSYQVSNYSKEKPETMYGIVGQQMVRQQQSMTSPPHNQMAANIIRKQQPIYQSNNVQIYGSVYNRSPNVGNLQTTNQNNVRSSVYASYPQNDIYNSNGLPSQYITKG